VGGKVYQLIEGNYQPGGAGYDEWPPQALVHQVIGGP
jgi:hypothetical protein